MLSEPDRRVPISALQHYRYCPRQCALIHVEQTYEENLYTLRGNRAHERVDESHSNVVEEGCRETGLPIWSERYGLTGKADVVEFREDGIPYPVEHKVGKRKERRADEVQLCGQALCLEEMFEKSVPEGAIYYKQSRRRREVTLDGELRALTVETISAVRNLLENQRVPPPVADARCPKCSLKDSCMPEAVARLQAGLSEEP